MDTDRLIQLTTRAGLPGQPPPPDLQDDEIERWEQLKAEVAALPGPVDIPHEW